MEIPLNVVRAFPSNSQRGEPMDEFRCVKERIEGREVLVERYGYRDHTAPISLPEIGGIKSYVSTLAISKM
jgi:hypothetical protein